MSHCYIINCSNDTNEQTGTADINKVYSMPKEKVMAYEEKSVGSTPFFKCEACPYMALAEDDIKFHLFTEHPELAKTNGLADNIHISCPGCSSVFDAEETLRTHLRSHHKMGIKDVKKMVKSLIHIALKNAKLKKEDQKTAIPSPPPLTPEVTDLKMPQLIEIRPDMNTPTNSLPKGVAFISVDELQKMSTPNFEKIDPKEIIQEASINIVYTNEISTSCVNNVPTSSSSCDTIQVSNVTPDLISSVLPKLPSVAGNKSPEKESLEKSPISLTLPKQGKDKNMEKKDEMYFETKFGKLCSIDGCRMRLRDNEKLIYHRKCHQNGTVKCLECGKVVVTVEALHTHLWKIHGIDLQLYTCDICNYKTFKKNKLYNIHMKCHGNTKNYKCSICSKSFKNSNQLSKHKLCHPSEMKPLPKCSICQREFSTQRRLASHVSSVHEKLRPFKCSQCDYTSASSSQLKLHSRSHTGDKPYACTECSYRSADHNAMRRHTKLHSKESLYKCKYCPYTTIQSQVFMSHMISKHPKVDPNVYRCPYCPFKSINKDKYVCHLTKHTDKEGIQLLIEMVNSVKSNKPSWTIPSESNEKTHNEDTELSNAESIQSSPKPVNKIPIEVYDCDSLSESLPQDYPKNYCTPPLGNEQQPDYSSPVSPVIENEISKEDNNSDCLITESSNDNLLESLPYTPQHQQPSIAYDNNKNNLHGFLNTSIPIEQSLLQNNSVNSLATKHSPMGTDNMGNNIMCNFPIRLPPAPHIYVRNNFTLKPIDKIPFPVAKVTGPIIKPTQILPVPSSSNSPVNISNEPEGAPRKKPKISVKSNLILKGPDQINMFHSQQTMAFERLEDNERFGLGSPVTFNNLITTQFMQLQSEPALSESPSNIMPYPQETMMAKAVTTPEDNKLRDNSEMFTFNQQMSVNSMTMLPPQQKIQNNDPSYIKLEATIKQNTQSPSLERMCNANILNTQAVGREYKASPPLEEIHKNIKNEMKSDAFYNIPITNNSTNPSVIDQYLIDNIIGEQYAGHIDLSNVVLPETADDQQNDVIEIDDNSDDNKLLPRFDMNFPMESFCLMHNDFHFLENDVLCNNLMANDGTANDMNRMVTEVPIINQKENSSMPPLDVANSDFQNFIHGHKDPMMNSSVRPSTNKINVKNIELMKR